MKIKKIALLLLFVTIANLSCPCFGARAADSAAKAEFSAPGAVTDNMTAALGTGIVPKVETCDGVTGWRLNRNNPREANIRFDIDNSFMYNLSKNDNVTVEIKYYDDSCGGFALWYDADSEIPQSRFVQLQNTGTWKTASFTLYDARFAGNAGGMDFYILTNDEPFESPEHKIMGKSSADVLIASVTVKKENTISPFDIKAESGKPGNIFFEGEEIAFDIQYLSDEYSSASVTYTVHNHAGALAFIDKADFENNRHRLVVRNLTFNVYILEIVVEGDGIYQTKTVDFSYSKKAEHPNKRTGTNIHFSRGVYDKDEIEAVVGLAKNAGYYFIRTSANWADIEQEKGSYSLPFEFEYANRFIDKAGLEALVVLSCSGKYADYPYWLKTEAERESYGKFCRYVAGALRNYTDYYSSPNEFNFDPGAGGVHIPEKYSYFTDIVKAAYPYIKEGNPNAYIVSGAVGSYWDEYIKNCYDSGILDFCDAFSIHVYDYVGGPETWYIYPTIQWHTELLRSYNPEKQSWITENGWPAVNDSKEIAYGKAGLASETKQAEFYPRSLAVNSDPRRVDTYLHYCFADNNTGYFDAEDNFGIIEAHDYRTPFAAKPAYVTTAAFNSILDGYTFKKDLYHGDVSYADLSEIPYHDPERYTYGTSEGFKNFAKSYQDARFAFVFENDKGEEITMVWMGDYSYNAEFKYQTDKPYIEYYDMYGNKRIFKNDGSLQMGHSTEPVYLKGVDSIAPKAEITVENTVSAWDIEDGEELGINVQLPENADDGTALTVAVAYDENGNVMSARKAEAAVKNGMISAKISAGGFNGCSTVKIFVWDSFGRLIPLIESKTLPEFGDSNARYNTENGMIEISGTLNGREPYRSLTVTAWKESTTKADYASDFTGAVIYQDMIKTDANGNYKISFKAPENENIKIQISGKGFKLQKKIFYGEQQT